LIKNELLPRAHARGYYLSPLAGLIESCWQKSQYFLLSVARMPHYRVKSVAAMQQPESLQFIYSPIIFLKPTASYTA
jgi:hypothetical protein